MLVDTDVLVWHMRGNRTAASFLSTLSAFALSAVTHLELVQGMRNKGGLASLRRALRAGNEPVLPVSERRAAGYVEQHLLSRPLRLADAMVAATAVEHVMPLAAADDRHYRPIADLDLRLFTP